MRKRFGERPRVRCQNRPESVEIVRNLVGVAPNWQIPHCPNLSSSLNFQAEFGPNAPQLAASGRIGPTMLEVAPTWQDPGSRWPNSDQRLPGFDHAGAEFDRNWPENIRLARNGPIWDQIDRQ